MDGPVAGESDAEVGDGARAVGHGPSLNRFFGFPAGEVLWTGGLS